MSSAVLLSATYFPFIRSLNRCILFLHLVAFPLSVTAFISRNNESCLSTCATHACLYFLTVSNTMLSIRHFFPIVLQIHNSMAFNLFLFGCVIDLVSDAYSTVFHSTLFNILILNCILKLSVNSFNLFMLSLFSTTSSA